MSFKDIQPGDKVAKLVAARFIQSNKGTLGVECVFEFAEDEQPERLNWQGWLSPAAKEHTMDTLVNVLGYDGNETTDANGVIDRRSFNDEQVKLVVELEEYEGKTRPKVKWVNRLGGSAFGTLKPETIKANLSSIGFRAAFLAAKQQNPKQPAEDKVPW